ncbi:distal long tail fiber assembly catalyst [Enterobacteria phage T6]|uniref:Receptor-recognizing protein gp38 n=1 Tax=Enterobacteria phage T6 TaxID=10666 RepID=O80267_BPT6|nr:tail fiber adhesin [Enterobacteria phage T6]AXN58309.1 distal long tail fiber assembly catalyst [Enterobacteria phage T6]
MAVVGVPGWIGSSSVNETGQRWMSQAAGQLRLGVPCWMSQFAGRSREIIHTVSANHNFNGQWFRDRCFEAGGAPIVFNIVGDIVSYSKDVPLFFMYGDTPNEYVVLNIHGGVHMWGRGGNGGSNSPGSAGGHCIQNDIGGRLRINNGGAIAGGGGGGGGGYYSPFPQMRLTFGGGGGRPFGAPGGSINMQSGATGGTISSPGSGSVNGIYNGGNGGEVGSAGGRCNIRGQGSEYDGGAAGYAVIGSAPTWQNVGAIYGPRV